MKGFSRLCLGVSSLPLLLSSQVAFAQSPAATTAAPSEEAGGQADIIVTAQKRSESLQRVPIAVSVATAATLRDTGASGIQSLKIATPSVEVSQNVGYVLPVIRGVGSKASGAGFESPVAIYVDGVYYAATTATLFSFNNIRQIEVLKGPQGTLFGRNATGGLIQVSTRDPGREFEGLASLTYGNYGTLQGNLYLTAPLTSKISADIAVQGTTMSDGYGVNSFDGSDVGRVKRDIGIRSKWLFEPGEGTEVRVILDYATAKGSHNVQRYPANTAFPAGFGPSYGGDEWDTQVNINPRLNTKSGGASLRIDQEVGNLTLASITAYRKARFHSVFDLDYSATPVRYADILQKDEQFTQELQLQSPGGERFNWTVGAYYFNAAAKYPPLTIFFQVPGGPQRNDTRTEQKSESLAGFVQADYELVDGLKLTAGLRYTTEKRNLDGNSVNTELAGNQVVVSTANASDTFKKLTWRASAAYQISPDSLVYASYNRGFKSGGFNASALTLPPFKPEVLDAYEIGLKTSFLDRRARFNAAAFYYDYKDVQVQRYVDNQQGVFNGAKARIYGLEAEISADVTDAFELGLSYQYLDTKYLSFPEAVIATPRPTLGGYALNPGSAAGNRMLLAPKSALNGNASYTIPAGSGSVKLTGNFYYNSGYFFEPDNVLKQDDYVLLNASVRWEPNERFALSVWGRNLSNEAVVSSGAMQSYRTFGLPRYAYEPPRTYGVTAEMKF